VSHPVHLAWRVFKLAGSVQARTKRQRSFDKTLVVHLAEVPRLIRHIGARISQNLAREDAGPVPVSTIRAEASVGIHAHHFEEGVQIISPITQSPLGSPVRFGRRAFKRAPVRSPEGELSPLAMRDRRRVQEAAVAATVAATESAYLLEPFWSNITGSFVNWQTDADVGLVLERRTLFTPVGRGRKEVVSIRKIWPWSPAWGSGAVVVHDILVSIDGSTIEEMELADVRAMLRGEEGSTVVLETLHVVKGIDLEPDEVLQQYVELRRSVDYLRREPVVISHRDKWPNPQVYQDRALFCLSLDSPLRRAAIYCIESRLFKIMSFLVILASSALIGLDDPLESTAAAQRQHIIARPCTTTQGDPCHFPFEYRGVTYTECTRTFYGRPWCSTTTDYGLDEKWGYCDTVLCDKLGPGYWRHQLDNVNLAVAALLVAETLPAIVAHGLVFGHNAFLKSSNNILDFVVLIANILDLIFTIFLPRYLGLAGDSVTPGPDILDGEHPLEGLFAVAIKLKRPARLTFYTETRLHLNPIKHPPTYQGYEPSVPCGRCGRYGSPISLPSPAI